MERGFEKNLHLESEVNLRLFLRPLKTALQSFSPKKITRFALSLTGAAIIYLTPNLGVAQAQSPDNTGSNIITLIKSNDWQTFLGKRTSEPFEINGITHIWFENGAVEKQGDDIKLTDAADLIHNIHDDYKISARFGVPSTLDPKTSINLDALNLPDQVSAYTAKIDLGQLTATSNTPDRTYYRFQKGILVLTPDGVVKPLPIGELAIDESLIPPEKILPLRTDDSNIQLSELDLLRQSYQKGGVFGIYYQWAALANQDPQRVIQVFSCENHEHDPQAKNPTSTASGLLQETDSAIPFYQEDGLDYYQARWDPVLNAYEGLKMFRRGGWGRWTCSYLV